MRKFLEPTVVELVYKFVEKSATRVWKHESTAKVLFLGAHAY